MRLLLDTHTFLLFVDDPSALPNKARLALEDSSSELFLSVASAWEMQIKAGIDKLRLRKPPRELVQFELDRGALDLLPISLAHIDELSRLPPIHRDPFDRMLIAQARCEGLRLVTADGNVQRYPVDWLWS